MIQPTRVIDTELKPNERILVALDVPTAEVAREIDSRVEHPAIDGVGELHGTGSGAAWDPSGPGQL